jgi:hypothetical protein
MKSEVRTAFLLSIFLLLSATQPLWAQLESPCEDHCKINTNLAGIVNVPLNPTAALATVGWGGVAGVGYNFNKRHAIVAEFMWNRVYPDVNSLQLLRTVLENSNLNAFTDFYVLTGNYRFELRGKFLGTYLIGGGGYMSAIPIFPNRSQFWALAHPAPRHGSGGDSVAPAEL